MEPKPDQKERLERLRKFNEAWTAADKDGDGLLTPQEFDTMRRMQELPASQRDRIFKRLDKDGDGKIAKDELRHLGMPGEGRQHWLRELDVDQSGGVSLEEFKNGRISKKVPAERIETLFNKLDTDGDGEITPKDTPQHPFRGDKDEPRKKAHGRPDRPMPPDPQKMIKQLDSNQDGSLSFEEFRAGKPMKEWDEDKQEDHFEKMDRNQDLKLTPDDFSEPSHRSAPAKDAPAVQKP